MAILKWFKTLFRVVREYSDRKPVTAICDWGDGRTYSFEMPSTQSVFRLPEVVGKPMAPDEPPSEPKMVLFELVHATPIDSRIVALYKPLGK